MSTSKRVAIGIAALMGFLFAAFLAREWHLATNAAPAITIDYCDQINRRVREANDSHTPLGTFADMEQILRTIQEADDRTAAAAFPNEQQPAVDYASLYKSQPEPPHLALAQRAMQDHQSSGRLTNLAKLPQLVGVSRELPGNTILIGITLPELRAARITARLLLARFTLQLQQGDYDAAVATLDQLVALGDIFTRQATLIDRLVGTAIHALAIDAIRDQHAAGTIQGPLAQRLLPIMQRIDTRPPLSLQFETERASTLDIIQRTFTPQGRFVASEYTRIMGNFAPPTTAPSLFMPRRGATERLANECYDAAIALAAQPPATRDLASLDQLATQSSQRNAILRPLLPSLSRTIATEDQILVASKGVQLLLALEVHRTRTGSYPKSLSELSPSIFAALPTDIISKDGQFRYILRPQAVATGRPFLLYSIGRDQSDNTGNEHPRVDISPLTLAGDAAGYDYVINRDKPSYLIAPASP
jgi:hypothetical protein